ncbi:MAG: glucosidase, partial [Deltaproteobacteria bacterium]|nr:glucosidase [Deltaproteobacteria bacterium]
MILTDEHRRLVEYRDRRSNWKEWGPYLSERSWGSVREDYSADGDAWAFFPHDHARSRAYRWGEDGLGGICDRNQYLCFSCTFWNYRDPILKERLFGLNGNEGNHGEDVKELYYYLDSTPTHSFMRMLYKYPQSEFPYADLIAQNRAQPKSEGEVELFHTPAFENDRYFDCFIEYAKAGERDVCIAIRIVNRSAEAAELCVIPTLWFRNTWSWGY